MANMAVAACGTCCASPLEIWRPAGMHSINQLTPDRPCLIGLLSRCQELSATPEVLVAPGCICRTYSAELDADGLGADVSSYRLPPLLLHFASVGRFNGAVT